MKDAVRRNAWNVMEILSGRAVAPKGLWTRSVADPATRTLQALERPDFRLQVLGHRVTPVLLVVEDHLHRAALADEPPGRLVLDPVGALERLGADPRHPDPDQE